MSKILYLTLYKKAFEVMITGEKNIEFRTPSKWMLTRLLNNKYDKVKFVHGYGKSKPFFICEFLGWSKDINFTSSSITYSNGLTVKFSEKTLFILLGKILEKGNTNVFM